MNFLSLHLRPTYCNKWPTLIVDINNQNLMSKIINNEQVVDLEFNSVDGCNTISIGLDNKSFGINGIWDTEVDQHNTVLNDLTLELVDVKINDVSVLDILLKNKYQIQQQSGQDHLPNEIDNDNIMRFNGHFLFKYEEPLLNSIINQKWKQDVSNDKSYFSNYTTLFHYEEDLKLIKEIYKLIDEAEKFNSKRS